MGRCHLFTTTSSFVAGSTNDDQIDQAKTMAVTKNCPHDKQVKLYAKCHYCGEKGHIHPHCPKYMKQIKSGKLKSWPSSIQVFVVHLLLAPLVSLHLGVTSWRIQRQKHLSRLFFPSPFYQRWSQLWQWRHLQWWYSRCTCQQCSRRQPMWFSFNGWLFKRVGCGVNYAHFSLIFCQTQAFFWFYVVAWYFLSSTIVSMLWIFSSRLASCGTLSTSSILDLTCSYPTFPLHCNALQNSRTLQDCSPGLIAIAQNSNTHLHKNGNATIWSLAIGCCVGRMGITARTAVLWTTTLPMLSELTSCISRLCTSFHHIVGRDQLGMTS